MSLGTGGSADGGNSNAGGAGAGSGTGSADSGAAGGAGGSAGAASGSGSGAGTGAPASGGDKSTDTALGRGDSKGASWRDSLPDDIKADATLSKYSDINNLAKAHIELQKLVGAKGIHKPGKGASPEEIKAFREALGIPTDPTKYELGKFEDGVTVAPETATWAQKMGAENGVEPSTMNKLIGEYSKLLKTEQIRVEALAKQDSINGLAELKKEWGDGFDKNLTRANFAAEKLGGKPLLDRLKKYGADNDPLVIKAFADAAKLYGEDTLREQGAGDGRQTPGELDAEIKQVQSQLFSLKPNDGAYLSVKNRYESLWKQKTGGR